MRGTARSYEDVARAFGVSLDAVNKWKQAGAPITRGKPTNLEALEKWRAARKTKRGGISIQTRNHYGKAIKEFSRWLARTNKTAQDPLAHLSFVNPSTDRRHDRRALTDAEFAGLVQAAMSGPTIEAITGEDRAMLYILAAWTGYRRKELASLSRRSFDLDGAEPSVTILACYSKNKRTDTTPLHPTVVDRLRRWLETKPELDPDGQVFPLRTPGGNWRKTALMMRGDLSRAGLPYQDEDGLFADFHANRHTFISNLGRAGVPLATAQKLARHSDPKLTANVYTHLGLSDKAQAIGTLSPCPASQSSGGTEKRLAATGTEDETPRTANGGKTLRTPCAEGPRGGTGRHGGAHQEKRRPAARAFASRYHFSTCRGLSRRVSSTPHRARTCNLRFRRPMLYPIELGVLGSSNGSLRPGHW